jgi:hypothetical protein
MKQLFLLSLLFSAGQALAFPWYSSGEKIRGAELMTPEERKAYATALPNMKSFDECRAFVDAHNLELDKRAREHNVTLPPISGDPCTVMKTLGRIK